jgi:tetratricopeptide (TPR) repeat protein
MLANTLFAQSSAAAQAAYKQGVEYRQKKDDNSAIARFTEAIRLDKNYASAYFERGASYRSQKEYDKAIADFTRVIAINPANYGAYGNRGMCYQQKRDYDRAMDDFLQMKMMNPEDEVVDILIAQTQIGLSVYTVFPRQLLQGHEYLEKGDYDKAIKEYTELIGLNHPDIKIQIQDYFSRGVAYYNKNTIDDLFKAMEDWGKVLELDPNNAEAKENTEIALKVLQSSLLPLPPPPSGR